MIKQTHDEAERKITPLLVPLRLQHDRYQVVIAEGVISEVLMDLIQRNHIDLAVLGTHGRRAFKKLLLGSIAEEVFRMAPCPVLTVGPKTAPAPAKGELRLFCTLWSSFRTRAKLRCTLSHWPSGTAQR